MSAGTLSRKQFLANKTGLSVIKDPGDTGELTTNGKSGVTIALTSGATAETRSLSDPTGEGDELFLYMKTDGGGTITVTADSAYNENGDTTLAFDDVGEFVLLKGVYDSSSALAWRSVASDGIAGPEQSAATFNIPLTSLRVHDAMATNLPATAANDDMGLVTTSNVPTLRGVDFGGTSTDEKGAFEFVLPPEYVAGGAITIRAHAGMLTTVSDGTATLDVECWPDDGDGTKSADICATAATTINSLTLGDKDFTITPTSRTAGEKLLVRLSFGGSDSGNAGVMIPTVTALKVLLDIKA